VLPTGSRLHEAAIQELVRSNYLEDEHDVIKYAFFLRIGTAPHGPHFAPIHNGCAGEVVYTVLGASLQRAVFAIDVKGLYEALEHSSNRQQFLLDLDNALIMDSSDHAHSAMLRFTSFVREHASRLPSHLRVTPLVVGVGTVIKATELHIVCARTARPHAFYPRALYVALTVSRASHPPPCAQVAPIDDGWDGDAGLSVQSGMNMYSKALGAVSSLLRVRIRCSARQCL